MITHIHKVFKVTHAQKRFDGPDDAPVETLVTVRDVNGQSDWVYMTAPKLGCSRDFMVGEDVRVTEVDVVRRWLTSEHAQTVINIVPAEKEG